MALGERVLLSGAVADIGGPGLLIALFAAFGAGVLLLAIIAVWLESLVLWRWLHVTYGRALRDALVMNVVSGLLGVPLSGVIAGSPAGIVFGLLGGFVLSVIVEGLILQYRYRHDRERSRARVWQGALLANVASYALLAVLVLSANLLGARW